MSAQTEIFSISDSHTGLSFVHKMRLTPFLWVGGFWAVVFLGICLGVTHETAKGILLGYGLMALVALDFWATAQVLKMVLMLFEPISQKEIEKARVGSFLFGFIKLVSLGLLIIGVIQIGPLLSSGTLIAAVSSLVVVPMLGGLVWFFREYGF